jgi:hypothetical protein
MPEAVLQGSLASFKLPDVLTFLSMARQTGTLVVSSGSRKTRAIFTNGSLVYAASDQEKLRLSAILLRTKNITNDQFQKLDELMRKDGGLFGQLAVQQGVLTEDQLRDFLKVQVSEVFYDTFVWTTGTFSFSHETDLQPWAVTITVDLANLIMEGARRIQEWEQCVALLPDPGAVFRIVSTPKDDKITLSNNEWKILFLINGQRTLDDLVHDAEEDRLTVYRVIYGLLANKLIEPVQRPAPANDTNVGRKSRPGATGEDTLRQTAPMPPLFGDATLREGAGVDDTELLVSTKARLSYSDVARPVVAQLVITDADSEARIVPLTEAEHLIGRRSENDIQLVDVGISGFHARIFRSGDSYIVEDMKSRNGTWLNGTRITQTALVNGDVLRLGATDLRYEVLYDPANPSLADSR